MPEKIATRPLTKREIDLAFPVVQGADPALTLMNWRRYAEEVLQAAPRSGIVGAFRGHYIHGVITHHQMPVLNHPGRVVLVDMIAYADLIDSLSIVDHLLLAVTEQAGAGTAEVQIVLSDDRLKAADSPLQKRLRNAGFWREGAVMCKKPSCAVA